MAKRTNVRAARRDTGLYLNEYYDGSAARKLAVGSTRPYDNAERKRREEERLRKAQRTAGKVHYKEAKRVSTFSISPLLTFLLIVIVSSALFLGFSYLSLKSTIDNRLESIKTLETSLESIRNENDAAERNIDTSIDLNYVYNVATEELGMVPAGKGNVIKYDKTESEYVRQYEDIPQRGD